jgi:hypothetical protein
VPEPGATLQRVGIDTIDGSGNLTLAASTASDTNLWIAQAAYTKALLSSTFSKVACTRYAIGIIYVVASGTAPQLAGSSTIGLWAKRGNRRG